MEIALNASQTFRSPLKSLRNAIVLTTIMANGVLSQDVPATEFTGSSRVWSLSGEPATTAESWQSENGYGIEREVHVQSFDLNQDSIVEPLEASRDPILAKQLSYSPAEAELGDLEGVVLEMDEEELRKPLLFHRSNRYQNYRTDENGISYLPGDGQEFGWLSFYSTPYGRRGKYSGLNPSMSIHLLSGPTSTPLPPRLYDFVLGYQKRDTLSDAFSYDVSVSVGVYSDFEDSARDGVRFPGHAVGMAHLNSRTDFVFGVDYLDRDDIKLLPVIGCSLHPFLRENIRLDLVFPRPKIEFYLDRLTKLYVAGLMDGGTWDIEFPDQTNDVMTYRDFRVLFGYEWIDEDGDYQGCEMGYVFDRQLSFRGLPGDTLFDDAFVVRFFHGR